MPTPLDNAMKSKNALLAFGGLITAVAVWSIYGGDMFPSSPDPTGPPEKWTREQMRLWLAAVGIVAVLMQVLVAYSRVAKSVPRKYSNKRRAAR